MKTAATRAISILVLSTVAACSSSGRGDHSEQGASAIEQSGDGRTSGHCRLDQDCDSGLDPICLRDATLPNGYCTSECVLDVDCDGESVWVYFDDVDRPGLCTRVCRRDGETDQGCFAITGASICLMD